jgi:SAM-dependent methyltransferase
MSPKSDPFAQFKAMQREVWSIFAPLETYTTIPAAKLVKFADLQRNDRLLDVACGTGVVAVTASRAGARATGLDLSPILLERARHNASLARLEIDFIEGDVEALPFPDASFNAVLSQFGHMFAPRPEVALAEMLRVLKPGGRLAFSTWPKEFYVGRQFELMARYLPPPPPGAEVPAPPMEWGNSGRIRERLGDAVVDLRFEPAVMISPSLSPQHMRHLGETAIGPLARIIAGLDNQPAKLAELRAELDALVGEYFEDNQVRQHFLMTRATKRS